MEAVESVEDPEVRSVLEDLRSLYALERIEAGRGWFLDHGRLAEVKAEAIRDQVIALCGEVRPHAVGLVDAFDLPDAARGSDRNEGVAGATRSWTRPRAEVGTP